MLLSHLYFYHVSHIIIYFLIILKSTPRGWDFVNGNSRNDIMSNFLDNFYGNSINIDLNIPKAVWYIYIWILKNNVQPSVWNSLLSILSDESFLRSINEIKKISKYDINKLLRFLFFILSIIFYYYDCNALLLNRLFNNFSLFDVYSTTDVDDNKQETYMASLSTGQIYATWNILEQQLYV